MSNKPTREQVINIFRNIDKDNSGFLSIEELHQALGPSFTRDEVLLMVSNLDNNFDGKISLAEFLKLFKV